jgi:DnaJ-class molecular chaperone
MARKEVSNACRVCGKGLEAHVCAACAGSGKVKAGLFGKRACETCGGTGSVLQCPDWFGHLSHRPARTVGTMFKPTSGNSATPMRRTCPMCKGTRGIRHPMTGQAGPCPRCKGKGWV